MPVPITIIGNAVDNAEVRTTNSGLEIVELRIASNDGKDKTSFWTAKFFANKAGETVKKHVKKGSLVMVSGLAEEETWDSKDGQKKSKIVCSAHSFNFLGGKPEGATTAKAVNHKDAGEVDNDENPIPF